MEDNRVNKLFNEEQSTSNNVTCVLLQAISPELLMIVFWVLLKLC